MSTRIGGSAAQPPTIEMPVAVDSNSMNQPRAMEQPKTAEPEAKSISAQTEKFTIGGAFHGRTDDVRSAPVQSNGKSQRTRLIKHVRGADGIRV
ncbi:hypothetical protein L0156_30135 [bacterium]|nr:hypothetical protein [bacterium]